MKDKPKTLRRLIVDFKNTGNTTEFVLGIQNRQEHFIQAERTRILGGLKKMPRLVITADEKDFKATSYIKLAEVERFN